MKLIFVESIQLCNIFFFFNIFHFSLKANIEIRQIIDFDVIQKNGKDYLKIKNVRVHMKLSKFSVNFDSKTGNPTINDTINKAINENWREIYGELKPDLEKNIGDVIKALISPIFEDIPYQEFFLHWNALLQPRLFSNI